MNGIDLNNAPFLLSLTLLNLDIQSPVLFLHLLINPSSRLITGNCELSIPTYETTKTQKMDITGGYRYSADRQKESQYFVSLKGMSSYHQGSSEVKITMAINQEWKKGKASYKYMLNEKWETMNNVYLKIKIAQPYIVPSSVLDIPPVHNVQGR